MYFTVAVWMDKDVVWGLVWFGFFQYSCSTLNFWPFLCMCTWNSEVVSLHILASPPEKECCFSYLVLAYLENEKYSLLSCSTSVLGKHWASGMVFFLSEPVLLSNTAKLSSVSLGDLVWKNIFCFAPGVHGFFPFTLLPVLQIFIWTLKVTIIAAFLPVA